MSDNNQTLQVMESEPAEFSAFGSPRQFETAQRMAIMLSASSIVPETFRGQDKIGNCVIALEIANRIGANILAVMQNLYIVYGKPAWSSQFLISCVNASRKFTPLRYRMTGKKDEDTWGCVAWAEDKTGEKLESPEVTIKIAKEEGWFTKNGSKWRTMPELMLRYRAATLFARLYAPELTMGIQTDDEMVDVAPIVTETARPQVEAPQFAPAPKPEKKPKSEPKSEKTDEKAESEAGLAPKQPEKQPDLKIVPPPAASSAPTPVGPDAKTPQGALELFMTNAGVTFDKFRRWVVETERLENADSFSTWSELPAAFCAALQKDGKAVNRCLVRVGTF